MTSRKRSSDAAGSTEAPDSKIKKSKVNTTNGPAVGKPSAKTDSNGDQYWEISKMRRVTVSEFRGKTMVSVREYYEKDGQELPGKKGISMPLEQFSALIKLLPEIEQVVQKQGSSLPRPVYSGGASDSNNDDQDDSGRTGSPAKQNIEATSDEESES
ncbi:RNA polymerase II transcriptional coactivator KELP [Penicillium diatomitis]|uniref:RNA polymerase II transcriptional coactivator KELP n=1 Tax=Penicillium diatomitis TaxID=2819901 RepID=A0A9W9X6P3_9EURO|nr:RNA polymerase II transcriptional coactivator KELP [Penicillium diatomitis]KAJ5485333.1 RNA polymerase II transcriptional coactivator KELP [Penicillium diatomitis]